MSEALPRARTSLEGLSVADALGGFFEGATAQITAPHVEARTIPSAIPWHYTDDTNMALSIVENLRDHGEIHQDDLAASFALRFDRARGYGMGMHGLVRRLREGAAWHTVAPKLFNGGSFGNGGAMRVAPVGAYFADDIPAAIENARKSCEVTHAHPEAVAGAIAVAVGAAIAWQHREGDPLSREAFIARVLEHIPDSDVRAGIVAARRTTGPVTLAAEPLGNGHKISAMDTIPLVLWIAGKHPRDYEQAVWDCIAAGGDVDTTAAMVGGIVGAAVGVIGIPKLWRERREPLPSWID